MSGEPSAPRSSGHDDTIPARDAEAGARSSGHDDTIAATDAAAPAEEAPAAGERYRLGAELGRGGMGRVVEAFDTQLGRTVALKEVLASQSASVAKRFSREVRITARLEHASIVPLYDAGVMADGRPFYVMRRVSGRPLDELIARARTLDDRLALLPNVLAAIDAVGHAHRRGVIHRDLKPANILVGELGETVVIDWGLAKVIGEEEPPPPSVEPFVPSAADSLKTQVGAVFGTPGFMAPEQARGDELDPRSDVFALGATLYQLIAGKPPIAGKSATEVIASTATRRIPPITRVAPHAPAELAAIIGKALAFEADQRYADAAGLGEDVRRFLTGQLVAAHRYTRRQRLVRFARRHRAPLSVAALAMTAVAVLAWVSVHRIVEERDAATAARAEAEHQRTVAETSADKARRRADQLLLAHARGLLDTSPTQAVAALVKLASTSPQALDEARAIAKAAVTRGVAWGVRSLPGPTTSFAMTRDGSRLLQVNRAGRLQVIDLARREQIAAVELGGGATAYWVAGDRQILVDRETDAALYDPASGALEPLDGGPIVDLARTPSGDQVAFIDGKGNAFVLEVATREVTPVWTKGTAGHSIAIAPDGSWIAFGDRTGARDRLVLVDRAGTLLAQRPGTPVVMGVSPAGKLAVSLFDEVLERSPTGSFTPIPLERSEAQRIHQLAYRGEVLQLVGARSIVEVANGRLSRGDAIADTVYLAQAGAGGLVVVSANDNTVHLLRGGAHLILPLTEAPQGMYRVTAAPGTARVAATAKDAILVWDTGAMFPATVDAAAGVFVANRRVVVPEGPLGQWFIRDLDSGARTPVQATVEGVPIDYLALAAEGRILVVLQSSRGTAVVSIRGDGTSEVAVEDLAGGRVAIVPGDAIVYSVGKNRVFGKIGSERSRELVSLDGEVRSLAANGRLGYAALSASGELVRGTFGGGDFARTKLTDLDKTAFVVTDSAHDVLVASGNRLLRWRGDVHELARFAAAIDYIAPTELGLYVSLVDHGLYFVPSSGDQTPQRVPIGQLGSIGEQGRVLAGTTASSQIELVDMPSRARWTLPKLVTGLPRVIVSPDGEVVEQSLGMQTAVWRLPRAGSDFAAWLAELTNATEEDGHLRWPWEP